MAERPERKRDNCSHGEPIPVIADLVNLISPERIILGGWAGLLLGERLLPAIQESARQHSLSHPFARMSIELGHLGPDAVGLGAATLPIEHFLDGTTPARQKNHAVG